MERAMRNSLLVGSAAILIAAAGCSRQNSAAPESFPPVRWSVAGALPQPALRGLAPSRARAGDGLSGDGRESVLVGGGALLVLTGCVGMNFYSMPGLDLDFYDFWMPGDSAFIGIPSRYGGWLFVPAGWIIGVPIDLVRMPFATGECGDEYWWTTYMCGAGFGGVGGLIVSLPFRILEWTFWDAPCAFGRFVSLHCRSNKSQVDWLIGRLKEAGESQAQDIQGKLEKLTGEKGIEHHERWNEWWFVHRDEFDSGMKRIKPPAPKPSTVP
jgi:hypothetical protein